MSRTPEQVGPLFVICGLFSLAALATRFEEIAMMLPAGVAAGILMAHFPLLLMEGYFESQVDYGESTVKLPLWMQIDSKPVRFAFTMAFTYLTVVALQTWDLEIGPIDPTPPEQWPLPQRAQWFAMMSVGMFFPNYLATTGFMVPALRKVGIGLSELPSWAALLIIIVVGSAAGFGVLQLIGSPSANSALHSVQSTWGGATEDPIVAVIVAVASVLLAAISGALGSRDK